MADIAWLIQSTRSSASMTNKPIGATSANDEIDTRRSHGSVAASRRP